MTPAEQTIYIDLATGDVRAGATGLQPPTVELILLTGGKIKFAFLNSGVVEALNASATGIFVIKDVEDAEGDPLFRDSAWDVTGSGTSARYTFNGVVDSDELRTILTGKDEKLLTAQLYWESPDDTHPSSSKPFAVTVINNYNRTGDAAPIVSPEWSFVLNAEEDAFEVFINGVSKGFSLLYTDPHP